MQFVYLAVAYMQSCLSSSALQKAAVLEGFWAGFYFQHKHVRKATHPINMQLLFLILQRSLENIDNDMT